MNIKKHKKSIKYIMKTISTLYRTLVRPDLECGNVIWGHRNDIIQVESIQRRATKMIGNLGHLRRKTTTHKNTFFGI